MSAGNPAAKRQLPFGSERAGGQGVQDGLTKERMCCDDLKELTRLPIS